VPAGHGLAVGDAVVVKIDWPRRSRLMRLHFAAELVLELVNQQHGHPAKLGAHIAEDKARLDFAWTGNIAAILPALQTEIARLVAADLPIASAFSDRTAEERSWRIDGFAQVPCGGTHPRSTAEVGPVVLKRVNPGAGKERIEILLAE
jgi:Ser-tRNA(Ala) deacylase AlaX